MRRKLLCLLLAAVQIFCLCACGKDAGPYAAYFRSSGYSTAELTVGDTDFIDASFGNGSCEYICSNSAVCTVDAHGHLTAVGVGDAQITVIAGKACGYVYVYVKEAPAEVQPTPVPASETDITVNITLEQKFNISNVTWNTVVKPAVNCWYSVEKIQYVKSNGGKSIYLRYGPSADYDHFGYVKEKEQVNVLAQQDNFALVVTPSSEIGWCKAELLVDEYPSASASDEKASSEKSSEKVSDTLSSRVRRNYFYNVFWENNWIGWISNEEFDLFYEHVMTTELPSYYLCDIDSDGVEECILIVHGDAIADGMYLVFKSVNSDSDFPDIKLVAKGRCSTDAYPAANTGNQVLGIFSYHGGLEGCTLMQISDCAVLNQQYFEINYDDGETQESVFTSSPWKGSYTVLQEINPQNLISSEERTELYSQFGG